MTSEKFIEGRIPCKECIVRAACEDAKHIPNINRLDGRAFYLPIAPYKCTMKVASECWANLGKSIMSNIRTLDIARESSYHEKDIFINKQLVDFLLSLTYLIQYIIDSKSWKYSTVDYYDITEIRIKFKQCEQWLPTKNERR